MISKDKTKEELIKEIEFLQKRIKELKKLESGRKQMKEEFEQLKSELVSTVSHELRTPLSITKEGISLVLDGISGPINEKQAKILTTARDNVDRLAKIINNLLDISKIESSRVVLKRDLINISKIIREVVSSFDLPAKEKGLSLKINVPSQEFNVYADPDKMNQVFTNLLSNAVKFTEKGYIEISAKELDNKFEFIVADTGMGISEEDLPKVFGKFQQFGRAYGAGEKGTGLGLSVVRGLVEMHKGKIWVESQLGKGTKFIFTLPKYNVD